MSPDSLVAPAQALINLERARGGAALLEKVTKLDDTDIDGLDCPINLWTVGDALSALHEIEHRLAQCRDREFVARRLGG